MDTAAQDHAYALVSGFRTTQMIRAVIQLKIPDLVAAGPRSSDELAALSAVQAKALRRVMQCLVAVGVFTESDDGCFGPNHISECFRDQPGSLRAMALMLPNEGYAAFGDVMHTLQTGQPAFEHIFGATHWEELAKNPERSAIFNAAMQSGTENVRDAVVSAYDFRGLRSVVDVGGGRGTLVAAVLKANPDLRGTILDLPAGLAESEAYLKEQGVHDRCQLVTGNFFESVPAGHDAYLLQQIVHDWSDEKAIEILATCRKAMGAVAKLIVVERIMPARADESDASLRTFMVDVQMLVVLGGRERTVEEFRTLFEAAGLRLTRAIPTGSIYHVIEGVPG